VDTESKLIVLVGRRCGAVTSIRHFDWFAYLKHWANTIFVIKKNTVYKDFHIKCQQKYKNLRNMLTTQAAWEWRFFCYITESKTNNWTNWETVRDLYLVFSSYKTLYATRRRLE
jgi:hypothetical protein